MFNSVSSSKGSTNVLSWEYEYIFICESCFVIVIRFNNKNIEILSDEELSEDKQENEIIEEEDIKNLLSYND